MKMRPRRAIMVWGTSSGAGKSLLATALCRWAARQGIDVAPFRRSEFGRRQQATALVEAVAVFSVAPATARA